MLKSHLRKAWFYDLSRMQPQFLNIALLLIEIDIYLSLLIYFHDFKLFFVIFLKSKTPISCVKIFITGVTRSNFARHLSVTQKQ